MAKRGEQLREHILWAAKDAFLELGFERTSMDTVSARAETSKRSLYAHFASKERLFLAVIELVRTLFLSRVKTPSDYPGEPLEALTLFCRRYLDILLYEGSVQMLRISMAQAERFPQQATQYFQAMFADIATTLSTYLKATFRLTPAAADHAAQKLLGQLLYPYLPRALFGIDPLAKDFDRDALMSSRETNLIRKTVSELIKTLPPNNMLVALKGGRD